MLRGMNNQSVPDNFDPNDLKLHVEISLDGSDEYNVLRQFCTEVTYKVEDIDEPLLVGRQMGWMTRNSYSGDLWNAADCISSEAESLGRAAVDIRDSLKDEFFTAIVMLQFQSLSSGWRGRKLTGVITDKFLDLLELEPDETIFVMLPEPQQPAGGQYPAGPVRDEVMAKLHSAYWEAGFEPWRESTIWWRSPSHFDALMG